MPQSTESLSQLQRLQRRPKTSFRLIPKAVF